MSSMLKGQRRTVLGSQSRLGVSGSVGVIRTPLFPCTPILSQQQRLLAPRATPSDEPEQPQQQPPKDDIRQLQEKFFGAPSPETTNVEVTPAPTTAGPDFSSVVLDAVNPINIGRNVRRALDEQGALDSVPIDSVNPLALGRQARRAFDEVWGAFSALAAPTKSFAYDDVMMDDPQEVSSQAAFTAVLVVGATGRVGRILTRKLLLRGYKVKALVRRKEGRTEGPGGVVEGVPAAVKIVYGDVGIPNDCQEAVKGVNKVVYCAGARSNFTAELLRVEETGVRNMVKAFQDECLRNSDKNRARRVGGVKQPQYSSVSKREIADFKKPYHQVRWDITFVGMTDGEGLSDRAREIAKYNEAFAEINDDENLIFEGVLYQRGAIAEVGTKMGALMPGGEHRTANTEGLVMRLRGDGKQYVCVLKTVEGHTYVARFPTRIGYMHLRLPWSAFRDEVARQDQPPLDPEQISYMGFRYEFRRSVAQSTRSRAVPTVEEVEAMKKDRQFELEVDWIKALPGGVEPDFILVSKAGKSEMVMAEMSDSLQDPVNEESSSASGGEVQTRANRAVEFKRRGEDTLRLSGLGYTIVRPSMMVDEPGGYKALVFDQGDRITEPVSAADVADICLRSMHEPDARNKTFDVCYEFQTQEGLDMYEMVAHVPDRNNSYLKAAVSNLVKNT